MVNEKYFLSRKMIEYAFDLDGKVEHTTFDFSDLQTINPTIAPTISVRGGSGSMRAGVCCFIAYGFQKDLSVGVMKKILRKVYGRDK